MPHTLRVGLSRVCGCGPWGDSIWSSPRESGTQWGVGGRDPTWGAGAGAGGGQEGARPRYQSRRASTLDPQRRPLLCRLVRPRAHAPAPGLVQAAPFGCGVCRCDEGRRGHARAGRALRPVTGVRTRRGHFTGDTGRAAVWSWAVGAGHLSCFSRDSGAPRREARAYQGGRRAGTLACPPVHRDSTDAALGACVPGRASAGPWAGGL